MFLVTLSTLSMSISSKETRKFSKLFLSTQEETFLSILGTLIGRHASLASLLASDTTS